MTPTVRDVMTKNPFTIDPEAPGCSAKGAWPGRTAGRSRGDDTRPARDPTTALVTRFAAGGVARARAAVPVVDRGRLVGLLTETDVLAAFGAGVAPGVRPVRALRRARTGGDYDHGFPVPGDGDAWRDNGAGN
jgi:CBS domain-containing protein